MARMSIESIRFVAAVLLLAVAVYSQSGEGPVIPICPIGQVDCNELGTTRTSSIDCIPPTWICDDDADCISGADEEKCPSKTCGDNYFKCNSTFQCIPNQWVCDTEDDCGDGSDEEAFACENKICGPAYWRCEKSWGCIEKNAVCNRQNDCDDGTDEADCEPLSATDLAVWNRTSTTLTVSFDWQQENMDRYEAQCVPSGEDPEGYGKIMVRGDNLVFTCENLTPGLLYKVTVRAVFRSHSNEEFIGPPSYISAKTEALSYYVPEFTTPQPALLCSCERYVVAQRKIKAILPELENQIALLEAKIDRMEDSGLTDPFEGSGEELTHWFME